MSVATRLEKLEARRRKQALAAWERFGEILERTMDAVPDWPEDDPIATPELVAWVRAHPVLAEHERECDRRDDLAHVQFWLWLETWPEDPRSTLNPPTPVPAVVVPEELERMAGIYDLHSLEYTEPARLAYAAQALRWGARLVRELRRAA